MTDAAARAAHVRDAVLYWAHESVPAGHWAHLGQIYASPRMRFGGETLTWHEVDQAIRHLETWGLLEKPDVPAPGGVLKAETIEQLVRPTANGSRLAEAGGSVEEYLNGQAGAVSASSVTVPAISAVYALGRFVQARAEEGVQRLLRSIPVEQQLDPDAIELLRVPRSLGYVAQVAAHELEGQLIADGANPEGVRMLWRVLLNIARPFRDHPDLPEGVREALAATDEAAS